MKINHKDVCGKTETAATCGTLDSQEGKTELFKLEKRERNRAVAYKSRQKQTQRADTLHQELEKLEKDNAALCKEIQKLQQEKIYWTKVLQRHEDTCILLSPDIILELLKPEPSFSSNNKEQFTDF
ncbi:basic leucine zipper transcriptional factor ATF-like 2 isoform X1 [Bufo bufo]|uniref:basic leucine zipper transcriptional factor ATF-like 2 isoform X1 n=1 Tax=Bufo bufo TaxID=8384 RepID=UPI001ABEBE17|nr:basic leucine zipper transcriptional factor ATF-like 2 isoform X1 [Bufo bufo]